MLNDDIRRARITAGLTQSELARRAGVPRQQVRFLEEGGNVTLATLRKVAPHLPSIKRLPLGEIELTTASPELEEARRAALDLFDVAKRLVAALGAVPPSERVPEPEAPAPGGGGATRHDSMEAHARRAEELDLDAVAEEARRANRRRDS